MDRDCFIIFHTGQGWVLQWNGRELSSFPNRSNAVRAANAAARISRARGRAVEILTPDDAHGSPLGAGGGQGG